MSDPALAPATTQGALLSFSDFRIRPHHCFACGELSEIGLHLDLHMGHGRCQTELELPSQFEGWEGIVHGGILCTILDEVMAWALVERDNWGVTAKMAVQFKRPALVGRRVKAEGWLVEDRRRIHRCAARIVDAETDEEIATAEATYVAATGEKKRQLRERYIEADRAASSAATAPTAPTAPTAATAAGNTNGKGIGAAG